MCEPRLRQPFPEAEIENARRAVEATLLRRGSQTDLESVLGFYDYARGEAPRLTARVTDAMERALDLLSTIGADELVAPEAEPVLRHARDVLRTELDVRREASRERMTAGVQRLVDHGLGIPLAKDGGWRPRFALVAASVGLGPADIARAEALAIVRHDPLLERHSDDPQIFFEDPDRACARWKGVIRRARSGRMGTR